jgi:hypothetical protein
LNFTLDILNVCAAQDTTQGTFVDSMTDAFASARHHLNEQPEMRRNFVLASLLLHQVARE